MANELTKIANIVLYPVKVPDEWKCEAIVKLPEKEDLYDCDHWRGITRGVATQGARGGHASPPLQFPNQTRSKSFNFKHQGYCFFTDV